MYYSENHKTTYSFVEVNVSSKWKRIKINIVDINFYLTLHKYRTNKTS